MTNNLQASSLVKLQNREPKSFLESKKIEFPKSSFKNIDIGSWIEIDSRDIKVNYIVDGSIVANLVLKAKGEYLYADINFIKKNKTYNKNRDKSCFTIKISIDRNIVQNSYMALSDLPTEVMILRAGKIFANANLYYNGSFLLEIKEIL